MKIVVLGAGALGTVLGAHLARAGEDVVLIARGNRAAYLQEHGATLAGLADFTVPVTVVTDPQHVQEADTLIVTVKTYDTASALASVSHMQTGNVLSIQNGVLKDEQLARAFGWEKVVGAMAVFSAEVLPTGTVRFTLNNGFYLGELPQGTSERVETLATMLDRAGIQSRVTPHIQSFEWSKYVAFVCLMAPAVLVRAETYKLLQDRYVASVVADLLHETARLAAARNIALEDTAALPIQALSRQSHADTLTRLLQVGDQFAARAPSHKISTLQDLEQGKRLEVEEILGYAVQQGEELGVRTPTIGTCYRLIMGINHDLQ